MSDHVPSSASVTDPSRHSAVPDRSTIRVLLDVSPIGSRPESRTGLARVALALGKALARAPTVALNTCACGSIEASRQFREVRLAFRELGGLAIQPGLCEQTYITATSDPARLPPALTRAVGQVINRYRNPLRGHNTRMFDVFHSTYASIPRVIRRARLPVAITVHDLTPLKLAPGLMPAQQLGITKRILRSIERDDWVVCVSEHTRRDFLEYSMHREDRVVTIYNGIDHEVFHPVRDNQLLQQVREQHNLGDRPFILTLSSLAPHKNLETLAKAWPAVRRSSPDSLLVVAGGSPAHRVAMMKLFAEYCDDDSVRAIGFVSDDVFRALASSCQAFAFPSLYEGFGLPVIEAMACGAPVICSHAAALPEVVGQAGSLIAPCDVAAWTSEIDSVLRRSTRTSPDVMAMAQARRFSWNSCAAEYSSLYQAVARSR